MSPCVRWWNRTTASKPLRTNIVKAVRGKRYWPHLQVRCLSRGGPRDHCGTLRTGYPYTYDLSQVPWRQTLHLAREGSGITTCPMAPSSPLVREGSCVTTCLAVLDPPPAAGELWRCHVSCGTGLTSRPRRAPASPCVPWFQTQLPVREGSGVAMCVVAPGPPPGRGGLWCHHVSRGSRPVSRCGRALTSPHATWHSTCYGQQAKGKYSTDLLTRLDPPAFEACPCILKTPDIRLIMTSPGTQSRRRIKCIQDSHTRHMGSLNAYKTLTQQDGDNTM
jgi:hypothetical protein